MAAASSQNPRYEAHENPPLLTSLGLAAQFSLMATATLLVTPVIVASESGMDDSYLVWMVFASLVVVGVSTLVQVRGSAPSEPGLSCPCLRRPSPFPFALRR